jgi:hypothetical protein
MRSTIELSAIAGGGAAECSICFGSDGDEAALTVSLFGNRNAVTKIHATSAISGNESPRASQVVTDERES